MTQTVFPSTTQDQINHWLHCSPINKESIVHVSEKSTQNVPGRGPSE